jgi:carboxypeptidase Taq
MHVMIRFELERAIFDNKIQVADLPKAWNEAYTRYLGVTPANDVEGILQDSHWSNGSFGYFPSYLLGTMIACQLYQTLLKEKPQLMQQVERGEMKEVQAWLKTAVHQYGRGKDTQAIMKDVTGKELSSEPFLTFLQERFLA